MAARAWQVLDRAVIRPFDVPAAKAITKGMAVMHSGADDAVEDITGTTSNAIGIALEAGAASTSNKQIALFGSGIVPVLLSSGAATRGDFLKYGTGGAETMTVGGGTTKVVCLGQALQSGADDDFIGANVGMAGPTVGS